jgi:hypothetical protein
MRFLGVLGLAAVLPRFIRQIAGVVAIRDCSAGGADRLSGHLYAVGPHVGDEPVLIERLGEPHRVAGGKAQFASRFLLQGRGGERRRRVLAERLGFDRDDGEPAVLDDLLGRVRRALIANRQPVELLAIERDQARGERRAIRLEIGRDLPIFLRFEQLDVAFAVDDQAERDRLDPPRRFGSRQLAPQDRRQREPDQIIECAARPVGIDQILIEPARMGHRLRHRRFGDGVEGDAIDLGGERLALPEHFLDVPADRLAFAVGIGRQDQRIGLLRRVGDGFQLLGLVRISVPFHRKAGIRIDRAILRRQVADMAIAGQHAVTRAEIFFDGLRLGRRFNDNKFQAGRFLYVRTRDCRVADSATSSAVEAHLVPGMAIEPPGKVKLEQDQLHRAGLCP